MGRRAPRGPRPINDGISFILDIGTRVAELLRDPGPINDGIFNVVKLDIGTY